MPVYLSLLIHTLSGSLLYKALLFSASRPGPDMKIKVINLVKQHTCRYLILMRLQMKCLRQALEPSEALLKLC